MGAVVFFGGAFCQNDVVPCLPTAKGGCRDLFGSVDNTAAAQGYHEIGAGFMKFPNTLIARFHPRIWFNAVENRNLDTGFFR